MIIKFRGLGRGMGFEVVERYSLLDGSDPELLELISDRVAVVYDMFYEDEGDEVEELTDEINEAMGTEYDTLFDAAMDLLSRYQDYQEEEEEEDEDVEDDDDDYIDDDEDEPLSELDRELLIGEREE